MISPNIVIMTRDELDAIKNDSFQRGVLRGRFEERADMKKYQEDGSGTAREAPSTIRNGSPVEAQPARPPFIKDTPHE